MPCPWQLCLAWDLGTHPSGIGCHERVAESLARPEYETWWRLWEEEGWVSLGRTRNFDWMHVQAAKL